MVRSVTRQIEPEYDELTRRQIEGLERHDAECCPGCGLHKSILDDFDNRHYTFEQRECPACAAQARYARVVVDQDDKATPKDKNGSPAWDSPRTPRPDDGRHLHVRELTPAEVEQRRKKEG